MLNGKLIYFFPSDFPIGADQNHDFFHNPAVRVTNECRKRTVHSAFERKWKMRKQAKRQALPTA